MSSSSASTALATLFAANKLTALALPLPQAFNTERGKLRYEVICRQAEVEG